MIASLPMYDRPELREETDALWRAIRDTIRARGMDAPEALDRTTESNDVWTDSSLVLSQTCGMPWRLGLHQQATLVGTPDYGVPECQPGYYHSVLIIRDTDKRISAADFSNGICAFNAKDSQSGFAAWEGVEFREWLCTGGHNDSIKAVANGKADIAAIDAVTWRYAERYDKATSNLRILGTTKPTPALPYITAQKNDAAKLASAVSEAIYSLDTSVRETLGLVGFVQIPSEVYLAV